MENSIFNLLDSLCSGEKSGALVIVRNNKEVTIASRGNHASVTCSVDIGRTPSDIVDAIMEATILNATYHKPDKEKPSCP